VSGKQAVRFLCEALRTPGRVRSGEAVRGRGMSVRGPARARRSPS